MTTVKIFLAVPTIGPTGGLRGDLLGITTRGIAPRRARSILGNSTLIGTGVTTNQPGLRGLTAWGTGREA
jgi:hypothetical protein